MWRKLRASHFPNHDRSTSFQTMQQAKSPAAKRWVQIEAKLRAEKFLQSLGGTVGADGDDDDDDDDDDGDGGTRPFTAP